MRRTIFNMVGLAGLGVSLVVLGPTLRRAFAENFQPETVSPNAGLDANGFLLNFGTGTAWSADAGSVPPSNTGTFTLMVNLTNPINNSIVSVTPSVSNVTGTNPPVITSYLSGTTFQVQNFFAPSYPTYWTINPQSATPGIYQVSFTVQDVTNPSSPFTIPATAGGANPYTFNILIDTPGASVQTTKGMGSMTLNISAGTPKTIMQSLWSSGAASAPAPAQNYNPSIDTTGTLGTTTPTPVTPSINNGQVGFYRLVVSNVGTAQIQVSQGSGVTLLNHGDVVGIDLITGVNVMAQIVDSSKTGTLQIYFVP